jgi:iron complex outermembrane receptor protein
MMPRPALLAALALVAGVARAADNPAEVMELGRIDVIATTPLPGLGTPLAKVPANVQVFNARALDAQKPGSLTEFLEGNAAGVAINSAQGNPFQPDVLYRGFVASPLLGLPQGIAVFQDGVRVNEPFGDVVNWDLIPRAAIASIQLLPGSNAAFGPNALGGALAIYTKSGSQFPGGNVSAWGGSFGRFAAEFEQGGSRGPWDYYVTGNALHDQGWAERNPSRIGQLFAKVGYQTDASDLDVSVTAADNTLSGIQALPRSFGDDIRAPYTWPDTNTNRLFMLAAKGSAFLDNAWILGATAYYRRYRNGTLASNVNDDDAPGAPEATNDRSELGQSSGGAGVQLTRAARIAGHDNRFVVGASADLGDARFTRFIQPARFTDERGTVGTGDYVLDTDADTRTRHYGVFASDTFEPDEYWAITASVRYNVTRIAIEDLTGASPGLDGSHRYSRASPALGITFNPVPAFTAYASYTESVRMPTAVELTCADPTSPCRLPNAFLTDPDLNPVIARTGEIGARGHIGTATTWSAAIYRTELDDDIQFVSSGGTGTLGYFRNVGRTRREGVELGAGTRWGPWSADARFAYVGATFRAPFTEASAANSSANARGEIEVRPGNRMPAIPQRSFKLRLERDSGTWAAGAALIANSSAYARGDENNSDVGGRVAGYAVANFDARWNIDRSLQFFARIDNAFDTRYSNFGVLGFNSFTGPNRTFDPANAAAEPFYGPGQPRAIQAGIRYQWR